GEARPLEAECQRLGPALVEQLARPDHVELRDRVGAALCRSLRLGECRTGHESQQHQSATGPLHRRSPSAYLLIAGDRRPPRSRPKPSSTRLRNASASRASPAFGTSPPVLSACPPSTWPGRGWSFRPSSESLVLPLLARSSNRCAS